MSFLDDVQNFATNTVSSGLDFIQNTGSSAAPYVPAAIAAYATGGASAGAEGGLFANAADAQTAAEIGATSGSAGPAILTPIESTTMAGYGPVAHVVTAGEAAPAAAGGTFWESLSNAGTYASKTLDVAGKVAGGINAISLATRKPTPAANFGTVQSILPVYSGTVNPGVNTAQGAQTAGGVSAGSGAAGDSGKTKDSTLTILASGLTVAAILYQFWKG